MGTISTYQQSVDTNPRMSPKRAPQSGQTPLLDTTQTEKAQRAKQRLTQIGIEGLKQDERLSEPFCPGGLT